MAVKICFVLERPFEGHIPRQLSWICIVSTVCVYFKWRLGCGENSKTPSVRLAHSACDFLSSNIRQ